MRLFRERRGARMLQGDRRCTGCGEFVSAEAARLHPTDDACAAEQRAIRRIIAEQANIALALRLEIAS